MSVLGELFRDEDDPDVRLATVVLGERAVKFRISPDDAHPEDALGFAAELAARLPELIGISKKVVCRDLLEVYNDGWNEWDEAAPDGSVETVRKPELSEKELISMLEVGEVEICGTEMVDVWFENTDLFWGHSILVTFIDGLTADHATAELSGL